MISAVEHVEFLVEEPSMEAVLRAIAPEMLPAGASFEVHVHQGKRDLLEKLPRRLAGYARWLPPGWRIVVLVDRDNHDCRVLKRRLETAASRAGLPTASAAGVAACSVINRLAIEELEAWYFGDWPAVQRAYPRVSRHVPRRATYRDPDAIAGGTWEALERELQRAGYFRSGLRKLEAARAIAPRMNVEGNASHSFQVLRRSRRHWARPERSADAGFPGGPRGARPVDTMGKTP